MSESVRELIIIGSGPAGLTAAIYAARANLKPLVVEGTEPGGQLMGTSLVENWPGEKSIMGPKLMMKLKEQAKEVGAEFLTSDITRVDFSSIPFKLWTHKEQELAAESVIIATGSSPNRLGCPGEDTYWGRGVTTCAVCDGAFYKDRKVVIVGGGDTAMEDASFLKKFTNDITVVQILDKLTASHAMQQRVINDPDITIMYNSTVSEIKGNDQTVTSVIVSNEQTGQTQELPADGVFIAIGHTPNTQPFAGQIETDQWGYIKVTEKTQTSVEGVFCAGDVHDFRYKQAITSAGSGCMAALDAERYLAARE